MYSTLEDLILQKMHRENFLIFRFSLDNDVWCSNKHNDGCNDREQTECYQTNSIQHHCRKLPVIFDVSSIIISTNFVTNHSNFLPGVIDQDKTQKIKTALLGMMAKVNQNRS